MYSGFRCLGRTKAHPENRMRFCGVELAFDTGCGIVIHNVPLEDTEENNGWDKCEQRCPELIQVNLALIADGIQLNHNSLSGAVHQTQVRHQEVGPVTGKGIDGLNGYDGLGQGYNNPEEDLKIACAVQTSCFDIVTGNILEESLEDHDGIGRTTGTQEQGPNLTAIQTQFHESTVQHDEAAGSGNQDQSHEEVPHQPMTAGLDDCQSIAGQAVEHNGLSG